MTQPSARRGIFWMVVTGVMFVTVTALVKYTDGRVPAAQSAFLRYLLGLVFLIPMIKPIFDAHLTKRQLVLFSVRRPGVFSVGRPIPQTLYSKLTQR